MLLRNISYICPSIRLSIIWRGMKNVGGEGTNVGENFARIRERVAQSAPRCCNKSQENLAHFWRCHHSAVIPLDLLGPAYSNKGAVFPRRPRAINLDLWQFGEMGLLPSYHHEGLSSSLPTPRVISGIILSRFLFFANSQLPMLKMYTFLNTT